MRCLMGDASRLKREIFPFRRRIASGPQASCRDDMLKSACPTPAWEWTRPHERKSLNLLLRPREPERDLAWGYQRSTPLSDNSTDLLRWKVSLARAPHFESTFPSSKPPL